MNGELEIKFERDMPTATVEVLSPSLEIVSRFMLAPGRSKVVQVKSKASFVRVHLTDGRVVTLKDPGNMTRTIARDDLTQKKSKATTVSWSSAISGGALAGRTERGLGFTRLPTSGSRTLTPPGSLFARPVLTTSAGALVASDQTSPEGDLSWNLTSDAAAAPYRMTFEIAGGKTFRANLPANLQQIRSHEIWSSDRSAGSLHVELRSGEPAADAILGYLQRGDLYSAGAMTEWIDDAETLLLEKMQDPYAAAVGAYLLLRLQRFERLHDWPRNLANWFSFLPDGPVIWAWQLINAKTPGTEEEIQHFLIQAAERGLPVYTEGARLLLDGLRLIGTAGVNARQKLMDDAGQIVWDSPVTVTLKTGEHALPTALGVEYGVEFVFGAISDIP